MEPKMSSHILLVVLAAHIYVASGANGDCYNDDPTEPDFPYVKDFGQKMKTHLCFHECRLNQNYRYAALQGTKCFCGAEFGKYGVTTGCTTKCAAAPLEGCGGHRKNLVYDIAPLAKSHSPVLKYINDGKEYKLNCEVKLALLGAEYKIDFIVEQRAVYSETLRNPGPRVPGGTISANMPAENLAAVMGKKLRCRVLSKWVDAPNEPTEFNDSAHPDGNTPEQLIGVMATREDNSVISADSPLMLNEGTAASVMNVKLTLPPVQTVKLNLKVEAGQALTCPYTGEAMDQLSMDTCQLTFTSENFNTNQQVNVQAVEDFKNDGKQPANINFEVEDGGPTADNGENPFVTGGTAGTANIITDDFPPIVEPEPEPGAGQCNSQNDPHMKTFDGRKYDCQIEGEFVLYRHKTLPFEVRTFYKRCNSKAVCNCAVAARVGDDVIVVDKCGATTPAARKPITIHKYSSSDNEFAPGFSVAKLRGGMTNIISMPNGARVKILWSGGQFLNVYMNPGRSDRQQTEGLCGEFDGRIGNDLTKQGGGVVPASKRPNAFSLSWRVTTGSMYRGLVPTGSVTYGLKKPQKVQAICSCLAGKDGNCDPANPSKKCERPAEPIVDPPTKPGTGDEFGPVDPTFQPERPTWPTDTGITEEEAEKFCKEFIQKSPAFEVCKDVGVGVTDAVENCMEDILLSGVKTWAQTAVEGLKEECENQLVTETEPELPPVFCLNDCSGNGMCGADGDCKCNAFWVCEDCRCPSNKPPTDVSFDPVCCDVKRGTGCNEYTVTGRFDPSVQYDCVAKNNGNEQVDRVVGEYLSFDQIKCVFNEVMYTVIGTHSMSIMVGEEESSVVSVGIFNSDCMTCDAGTVTTGDNVCVIGLQCFNDGDTNPGDDSLFCDAADPENWTKKDPCKSKGCDRDCTVEGDNAVCSCPDAMEVLNADGKTCDKPCEAKDCQEDCELDGDQQPVCICRSPAKELADDGLNCIESCTGDMVRGDGGDCECPQGTQLGVDQNTCVQTPEPCDLVRCSDGCENQGDVAVCTCSGDMEIREDPFTCVCPEGMVPGDDPNTCKQAPEPCDLVTCSDGCENQGDVAVCTCSGDMEIGDDPFTCVCPEGMVPGDDPNTCKKPCDLVTCSDGCENQWDVAVCTCSGDMEIREDPFTCVCPEGMVPGDDPNTCKQAPEPCDLVTCSDGCENQGDVAVCTCSGDMEIREDPFTCVCPEGMVPGDDPNTCKQAPPKPCDLVTCSDGCENQGDVAVCTCSGDMEIRDDPFTCVCPEGMVPGDDPNTCKQAPVPCPANQVVGVNGDCVCGPTCRMYCPLGYEKDENGCSLCQCVKPVVNPCDNDNGGCGVHTCVRENDNSISCQCNDGYTLNPDGDPACLDIDECMLTAADGGANCEHFCQNNEGSFRCGCPAGELLQVDGRTCEPDVIDPCDECVNNEGCEHNGEETVCTCGPGYQLAEDDRTCIDINECEVDNGGCLMECYNAPGTHSCQCDISCKPGYVQEGNKCVGACSVNNGGCSHICDVNDGEVECSCPNAGRLDPLDEKTCLDPCPNNKGGGCEEICETSELFHVTCKCDVDKNIVPANDDGTCTGNRLVCKKNEVVDDGKCVEKCNIENGGCHETAQCVYDDEGNTDCSCITGKVAIKDGSCHEECTKGFEMDMDSGECRDIDECILDTDECEQECVNTEGSFTCECPAGELLQIDGRTCEPEATDPCEVNKGGCEHKCVYVENEEYKCECDPGFALNEDRHSCDSVCDTNNGDCRENSQCELTDNGDVRCPCETGTVEEDEQCVHPCDLAETPCGDMICEEADTGDDAVPFICQCPLGEVMNTDTEKCEDGCKTYGCDGTCINLKDGTYECECDDTEVLNEDGKTCDDKDECKENNGECIKGQCVNDVPGHHCECDAPLELDVDGRKCIDYNVCLKDKPCDHECEDLDGRAYVCTCRAGYELASDKTTCLEKCKVKNGGCEHTCDLDGAGSVVCECRDGYRLGTDGKSCDDIDECEENTDECDMTCENTEGSYKCSCPEGTELHTDGKQCLTVDPCIVNKGGCSHYCTHRDGQAVCSCPEHMELMDDKQTCRHVCDREDYNGCDQVCDRKSGGCTCNQGWELAGDGKDCDDIDECREGKHDCEQVCNNVEGSFDCSCGPGYTIKADDPTKCDDIDECKVNNGGCRQRCANMPGSYRCECDDVEFLCADGYTRDPDTDKCHSNLPPVLPR